MLDQLFDVARGPRAGRSRHLSAAREHGHRWNRSDLKALAQIAERVGVHFDDEDFSRLARGDFLELSDDGSPVIWERVPVPQIDDESVIRRLAVGPDHALYLMQVNAHEVSIYRR